MSKFNKEIEIKFKVDENILSKLKNIELNSFEETDEYFTTKEMLDNDTFLRFRKKQGKIFLMLKDIIVGGSIYEANEISLELNEEQYNKLKKIFEVVFPFNFTVNKKRSKGFLNDCEICVDKVDELGNFLEIEGPKEKILELCKQFNLDMGKSDEEKGYAHMMAKKLNIEKGLE